MKCIFSKHPIKLYIALILLIFGLMAYFIDYAENSHDMLKFVAPNYLNAQQGVEKYELTQSLLRDDQGFNEVLYVLVSAYNNGNVYEHETELEDYINDKEVQYIWFSGISFNNSIPAYIFKFQLPNEKETYFKIKITIFDSTIRDRYLSHPIQNWKLCIFATGWFLSLILVILDYRNSAVSK